MTTESNDKIVKKPVVNIGFPDNTASQWLSDYQAARDNETVVLGSYDELKMMCEYSKENPVPESELEIVKNEIVEIFNATHAVVSLGSKTVISEKSPDHKGELTFKFTGIRDQRAFFQNLNLRYITDEDESKRKILNCFDVWVKALERKTYQGVVFDPSLKAALNFLNMWDGFQVEPIPGKDRLDKILGHLEHVVCDGNYENYQFLLACISHLFQKPEEKSGVCLVLKSEERGTGKSTVTVILEKLLGHHCGRVSDAKHLFGNFNAHLANKLVVAVEESFWSGSPRDAGKLRTMITESTITIEGKGKDAIEVESFHRFILLTNNAWAVPASIDERRFFVLKVSNRMMQNQQYFKALYRDIKDPIAMGQLLHFFLNFDISSFDLRKAKMTDENKRQIVESMQPEEQWLQHALEEGFVTDSYGKVFELREDNPIPKSALHDDYIRFCNMMKLPNHSLKRPNKLGEYIAKVILPLDKGKKATIRGRLPRVNCYLLRPLEEMRSLFNKYYHQD